MEKDTVAHMILHAVHDSAGCVCSALGYYPEAEQAEQEAVYAGIDDFTIRELEIGTAPPVWASVHDSAGRTVATGRSVREAREAGTEAGYMLGELTVRLRTGDGKGDVWAPPRIAHR